MRNPHAEQVLDVCAGDIEPGDQIELHDARGALWEVTDVQSTTDGEIAVGMFSPDGRGQVLLSADDLVRLHR